MVAKKKVKSKREKWGKLGALSEKEQHGDEEKRKKFSCFKFATN